jgi:hypothetical protein
MEIEHRILAFRLLCVIYITMVLTHNSPLQENKLTSVFTTAALKLGSGLLADLAYRSPTCRFAAWMGDLFVNMKSNLLSQYPGLSAH